MDSDTRRDVDAAYRDGELEALHYVEQLLATGAGLSRAEVRAHVQAAIERVQRGLAVDDLVVAPSRAESPPPADRGVND